VSDLAIVNASPLVFLGNAGHLELLRAIGSRRFVVPHAVFEEVVSSKHCDRASVAVKQAEWLERATAGGVPAPVAAWDLGPGESEVIALGLANPAARLVIDDLAGRKCGLALGLDIIGTLGVVIAAHRRGVVADPALVFSELRAAGMWVSDAVIATALRIAAGAE
jgi:predicted nucleic acid-binding protein